VQGPSLVELVVLIGLRTVGLVSDWVLKVRAAMPEPLAMLAGSTELSPWPLRELCVAVEAAGI